MAAASGFAQIGSFTCFEVDLVSFESQVSKKKKWFSKKKWVSKKLNYFG